MKRVRVKLLGSTIEPFTISVTPGMTAGEILASLNLSEYVLAIPPAPNRYFAPGDAVYDELLDGDFLLAVPPPRPPAAPSVSPSPKEALGELPMKTLTILIYGSKRPPFNVRIRPGTKTSHVLAYLKLSNYALVPAGAEDLAKVIFKHLNPSEDDLYERVADGAKLIALPPLEAARIAYADMLRNSPLKETIR